MEFTSQICTTKEQSERLLALGLKKETADCILVENPFQANEYIMFPLAEDGSNLGDAIPAWSLHRLLCLLPEKTPYNDGYLTVEVVNENVYILLVIDGIEQKVLKYTKGNLYDNLINCIKFYIKECYFNKENLEE